MNCLLTRSLTLICLAPTIGAAAGADLRPKFAKDQVLHYINTSNIDQTMIPQGEGAPPEIKTAVKSESGMRFKVLETNPDGSAVIEWTMLYLTLTMTGGPMPADFDSRDPARQSPPFGPMLKMMINKPATVSVNAEGRVTEFKGFDPASLGPMGQSFGQFFSKEAFEQSGLIPTAGAPNPAEPGAEWSQKLELALPQGMGTMIHQADYKLAKVDEAAKMAQVEVKGKSTMKEAPSDADVPPAMTIEKADSSGTLHWDLAKGQMQSTETTGDMAMNVSMPMGTMAMKQKVASSIRRAELAEFKLPPVEKAGEKPAATAPAQQ